MFDALLQEDVQDFIKHYKGDISQLALKGSTFKNVSTLTLITQIESRNKAQKKLPTWFKTKGILYPNKLNIEQTSSEITAAYKNTLVQGKTLADITGGFGIDSYYFSETIKEVSHFELNKDLSKLVAHNNKQLKKNNIQCTVSDGIAGIKDKNFDVIYVDPSRRNEQKGKVFFLKDCLPNIPSHISYLLERCNTVLIKTSPMLDISVGLEELKNVVQIHIVAVHNDVKEILWVLQKEKEKKLPIYTVNFTKYGLQKFQYFKDDIVEVNYSTPQKYLYEPNAAILKSGAFNQVTKHYSVLKLHPHSHVYTSQELVEFPGRRFKIEAQLPYSKKEMRHGITFDKANITTRNFPESVAMLRKKWKIKEGGNQYLFFTTIENDKKIVLICSKITHEI